MKKIALLLLLAAQPLLAQDNQTPAVAQKHHEVRTDLVSMITAARVNLTYEYFLNERLSFGITGGFSNSKSIEEDFNRGNRNNLPLYDVSPFARYNLSNGQRSFYFAEVFAMANGGDYREIVRRTDGATDYFEVEKSTYSDMAIGAGLGYKIYIKDALALEVMVGYGLNLIDTEKSPDNISKVGLSVGYRF
ncbi:MAG TPA: outer membrane beta-barrel protein [Flavobacterium sp.]|nr:outer membrane beta-barrel protein [Flavobacterium sp.]